MLKQDRRAAAKKMNKLTVKKALETQIFFIEPVGFYKESKEQILNTMKTYEDYKNKNEAGEWIEDVFSTTVGELEKFGHGWNFQNKYNKEYEIKIKITNANERLEACWMDDFDSNYLDIEIAIETINSMNL